MATESLTEALRETLALFDDSGTPWTTNEVADRLDLGRRSTYDRLSRLTDRGQLATKKVGASARVWWRPPSTTVGNADRTPSTTAKEFESLVEAVEEYAIFTLDVDGHVQTWNTGAELIKGYGADEVLGQHFSEFYTAADRAAGVPEANLETAATSGAVRDEGWRVRADGSRFWAQVTITAVRDDEGTLQEFLKVTHDLTECREAQRRLQRERDIIDQLFETSPVAIGVFRADGDLERANEYGTELFGVGAGGETEFLDTAGDPLAVADCPHHRVLETGEAVMDRTIGVRDAAGDVSWLSVNATPVTDDAGELRWVITTAADVTVLKDQASQLRRQRDDLESELEDIFDRIDDGFYALDEEFQFTYANERAAALFDASAETLLCTNVRGVYPDSQVDGLHAALREALDTGEPVVHEAYYAPAESWLQTTVYPSGSGLSVYVRDVSERRARDRELDLYETIVATMQDGVYVLDDEGCFTLVNDAYVELTGYDREELLGAHCTLVVDEAISEQAAALTDEIDEGDRSNATIEANVNRADGTTIRGESRFTTLESAVDDHSRKVGVVRDVSERAARERELEETNRQLHTLVDHFPNGAIALVDTEMRYVVAGGTPVDEVDAEDLLGRRIRDVVTAPLVDVVAPGYERALAGEADAFETEVGGRTIQLRFVPVRDDDGTVFGAMGISQDVSDQKRYEIQLERQVQQLDTVSEFGMRAMEVGDLDELLAEATELVASVLDYDYCKVLELDADADVLELRQGVGWHDGLVGSATVSAVESDSQAAYTLAVEDPVVVEDLETESRFSGPDLLTSHGVRGGVSVVIGPSEDPWGILGTHDTQPRTFTEFDVDFVQSIANVLASAIDRFAARRELLAQSDQLIAMNDLNEAVHEITQAVIDQSTRQQIEATVCEHLVATSSYTAAWIGSTVGDSPTNVVRARAGDVAFPEDAADPIDADAAAFEFPITHQGMTYGTLTVRSERANAFSTQERAVLDRLGEVVGHAIVATERKQALIGDEVVELEYLARDVFAPYDLADLAGRFTVDHTVPAGDDEYLVYGSATAEATESMHELAEVVPYWQDLRFTETDEGARYWLRLSETPLLATIAEVGGLIQTATVEEGDFHLRVHVAPGADTRQLTAAITAQFPTADLQRRRQLTRRDRTDAVERALTAEVTDRQRAILYGAYHAGYFEWPRAASGEAIADSFDISPPTFHQHLRTAERKVFESLLAQSPTSDV
ncbi:PAS domain S-box protein [Halorarius litoreus]|uniref:PAS domain S-box protein n=1 Tax=Halorarius litoreus TaxID=2962676 RepID=UPI0020CCB1DA|nr:PAS domain S-box protein [Halorarius litoreus]